MFPENVGAAEKCNQSYVGDGEVASEGKWQRFFFLNLRQKSSCFTIKRQISRAPYIYEIPMSINQLTIVNQAVEQKMFSTNIAASNSDCIFTFICLFSGFFLVR